MTLHLVGKKGNRIPPVTNQSQQGGSSLCVDVNRPTHSLKLISMSDSAIYHSFSGSLRSTSECRPSREDFASEHLVQNAFFSYPVPRTRTESARTITRVGKLAVP